MEKETPVFFSIKHVSILFDARAILFADISSDEILQQWKNANELVEENPQSLEN